MTTAVVVPLHVTDDHRLRAWDYVRRHYQTHHPDWPVHVGTWPEPLWNKGAAVHDAVTKTDATKLIITDADVFIDPERMETAVDMLDRNPWVMPQTRVRRLSLEATEAVYGGAKLDMSLHLAKPQQRARPGGGLVVVTRQAYDTVGGIDPRFGGWGFEDLSFGYALETLTKPHWRIAGVLWHLWHPRNPDRNAQPELAARFRAAKGRYAEMRALIDERTDHARTSR